MYSYNKAYFTAPVCNERRQPLFLMREALHNNIQKANACIGYMVEEKRSDT